MTISHPFFMPCMQAFSFMFDKIGTTYFKVTS
jgi:hypothetical protein